ncbi:uncharacterized protein LOC123475473 isoform X1 [Daphnia magna]|uniref:uncharacterized protein LOC123475473 isoform X1 n=1 Tax=Daphnia magna TaxID=35525 RepID=UPI001E1BDE61|nr:uncharacterized protein LOC123475473 isoform X1 [Daphnia magna]
MILLVLFSLLVGNGMTTPLYLADTFGIPLLRTLSSLKSAAYQEEDRSISRDLEVAFNIGLFALYTMATPFIDSVVALCVVTPSLCSIKSNGNSIATVNPLMVNANLRNLASGHPNLLIPFALDREQQTNYFKFSNLYPPAMVDNDAYPDYPTPSFAIVAPYLMKDQFLPAMRHNLMVNFAHHPLSKFYNVVDTALDDLDDPLS